jgi:hypothetical protein
MTFIHPIQDTTIKLIMEETQTTIKNQEKRIQDLSDELQKLKEVSNFLT